MHRHSTSDQGCRRVNRFNDERSLRHPDDIGLEYPLWVRFTMLSSACFSVYLNTPYVAGEADLVPHASQLHFRIALTQRLRRDPASKLTERNRTQPAIESP